jgi:hypothetical protein
VIYTVIQGYNQCNTVPKIQQIINYSTKNGSNPLKTAKFNERSRKHEEKGSFSVRQKTLFLHPKWRAAALQMRPKNIVFRHHLTKRWIFRHTLQDVRYPTLMVLMDQREVRAPTIHFKSRRRAAALHSDRKG